MKTIKNFLLKKRIKVLKSKKGFSLIEVLIGVTIIGIISAIAVPRFKNYRDSAAFTATTTTGKNLAKAYNLCSATQSSCTTLAQLKISCDNCETPVDGTTAFCVAMKQTISGQEFKSCVHVDKSNGTISQNYGGEFKFCYGTSPNGQNGTSGDSDDSTAYIKEGKLTRCDDKKADCEHLDEPSGANKWTTTVCKKNTTGGTCTSGTGVCV